MVRVGYDFIYIYYMVLGWYEQISSLLRRVAAFLTDSDVTARREALLTKLYLITEKACPCICEIVLWQPVCMKNAKQNEKCNKIFKLSMVITSATYQTMGGRKSTGE